MKNVHRVTIAAALFAAVALVVVGLLGEVITVRAEDNVLVRVNPMDPYTDSNVSYTLRAGEEARVDGCEDLKTDIAIRVKIHSGATGYVAVGEFSLERRSALMHLLRGSFGDIAFSCRGMFLTRSRTVRDAHPSRSPDRAVV